ncbi:hypothetical protein, partial [Brucella melitensis]
QTGPKPTSNRCPFLPRREINTAASYKYIGHAGVSSRLVDNSPVLLQNMDRDNGTKFLFSYF